MKTITHAAFSLLISILIIGLVDDWTIFLSLSIIGALLPDIDSRKSSIGRMTRPISDILNLGEHRGALHSIFTGAALSLAIYVFSTDAALGFIVGYGSHLSLDMMTHSGIPIMWPLRYRLKGMIKTGSAVEYAFLIAVLSLIGAILLA